MAGNGRERGFGAKVRDFVDVLLHGWHYEEPPMPERPKIDDPFEHTGELEDRARAAGPACKAVVDAWYREAQR